MRGTVIVILFVVASYAIACGARALRERFER
jgi:hypothetical protein